MSDLLVILAAAKRRLQILRETDPVPQEFEMLISEVDSIMKDGGPEVTSKNALLEATTDGRVH